MRGKGVQVTSNSVQSVPETEEIVPKHGGQSTLGEIASRSAGNIYAENGQQEMTQIVQGRVSYLALNLNLEGFEQVTGSDS